MEEKLRERISDFMNVRGYSVNRLANDIGVQTRTLQNQIRSNTAISASVLLEILFQYKDLSAEWLMRGVGDMFLIDISSESELLNKLREQSDLIKRQQREIDGLYERIKELKKEDVPSTENLLAAG